MQALQLLFALIGLGCAITVLIQMFQDEIWKGVVGLFCGLYILYYAVVEFESEYKWLIVAGLILSSVAQGGIIMLTPHTPIPVR